MRLLFGEQDLTFLDHLDRMERILSEHFKQNSTFFEQQGCCPEYTHSIWRDQKWICEKCNKETDLDYVTSKVTSKRLTCTCGASKTTNPNCHSTWCDGK